MIVGVGTDIVNVGRLRHAVERWGTRFLSKIFTEEELTYCLGKKDPCPHLAARFAAKEAAIKALSGLGGRRYSLTDIEVRNDPSGRPFLRLLQEDRRDHAGLFIHVTLSHERETAISTVVLEMGTPETL